MANIINIIEENNILMFKEEPMKIVCGNTNYYLNFEFSEDWQGVATKIAVFVVDGVKTTVEFEGNECNMPALPNSTCCFMYVISGDESGESLVSSSLRFALIPSSDGSLESDFEGFKNYLSLALEKLKQFEQGNYVAKTAEESLTQVDLSSDQTIYGVKNFVDQPLVNGVGVATEDRVINKNFLLNSEFKINQRGAATYKSTSRTLHLYTVDRWRIFGKNASFDPTTKQAIIYLTQKFTQIIETPDYLKGKMVTATLVVDSIIESISMVLTDGVNTLTQELVNGVNSISMLVDENSTHIEMGLLGIVHIAAANLKYAKLEIGDKYTGYYYKSYEDDLLECQRYLFRKTSSTANGCLGYGSVVGSSEARVVVLLPAVLRTSPTFKMNGNLKSISTDEGSVTSLTFLGFEGNAVTFSVTMTSSYSLGASCGLFGVNDGDYIEFDSEIYN